MREIPLYLFTGFLESGKTRFIQGTLEDPRFHSGEKTLLLICEEGEEDYDPTRFAAGNVTIRTLEGADDLTRQNLERLARETDAERILVEYNGMWLLSDLFNALPENFVINQEICTMDANTVLSYNANMRQLVFDKLSTAELVIFNRCPDKMDVMPLHKLVRAVSRRADIAYEYENGYFEYDQIEDPLPFDLNADVIEIEDRDFALWFQDMMNDMKKYIGKTLKFKGVVAREERTPDNVFVVGRHVMTCCAEDVQYCGIACDWKASAMLKTNDWVKVTAKFSVGKHKLYRSKGPYLTASEVVLTSAPEEPVASFY